MRRLWKFLFVLLLLAVLAFVGYAYFGDLSPTQDTIERPVDLDDAG